MAQKLKVYLAHPISTKGEYEDSKRVANRIRDLGYEVYVASENDSINDKSNHPTPRDIYNGDVEKIIDCQIFVVNLTGGLADGTISEIGVVSGYNEAITEDYINDFGELQDGWYSSKRTLIVGYTSNARLLTPQFYQNIPSAGANHLVLGMIDTWGSFVGTEDNMIDKLSDLIE